MKCLKNPLKNVHPDQVLGLPPECPYPSVDAQRPLDLLRQCPAASETPLISHKELADELGIKALLIKDERQRMALGSFKALGAAYVIASKAYRRAEATGAAIETALEGQAFVTASAGNHGLSVAAGAQVFGAKAVIYLSHTVPGSFGHRLEAKGAEVRFEGDDYEASMQAAAKAAADEGLILLSDSSWEGYYHLPHQLMEGYLVLMAEAAAQMPQPPTHILLQAGVGGLAAASAAFARHVWGNGPVIGIVEPDAAPCLMDSIEARECLKVAGPVSNMGRLDCKEPSHIALRGLARDADYFLALADQNAAEMTTRLMAGGIATTPSGCAGIAGLALTRDHPDLRFDHTSIVLTILSEAA